MATGILSNNVDFDDIFELRGSGSKAVNSGYLYQGVDLSERYLARGSVPKRADVGYALNGSDVSNLWMPKGSMLPLGFDGKTYSGAAQAPTGGTTNPIATMSMIFQTDGTWVVQRAINGSISDNGNVILDSGRWLPEGQVNTDFTVQFSVSLNGGGTVANNAASASALTSNRTTSVQTQVPANSAQYLVGDLTITARLVRTSTGSVISATCTLQASALGYQ